jgi:hypothetical protein
MFVIELALIINIKDSYMKKLMALFLISSFFAMPLLAEPYGQQGQRPDGPGPNGQQGQGQRPDGLPPGCPTRNSVPPPGAPKPPANCPQPGSAPPAR